MSQVEDYLSGRDVNKSFNSALDQKEIPGNSRGSLEIKILDRTIRFQYPDSVFMKNIIINIFHGKEYPIFRPPDYSPGIILDVGANVGATALYFYSNFPESEVYCYEPSRENYKYLCENTKYFSNIRTYPYGLFNKSCEVPLYMGTDHSAMNSIIRNKFTSDYTENIRLVKASEEIVTRKLNKISILKLDTEGCEVPILYELLYEVQGLDIDMIYVEYHSEDDRLELDIMASERFLLFYSSTNEIHRGTNGYVSKALVSSYPGAEWKKIKRDKG